MTLHAVDAESLRMWLVARRLRMARHARLRRSFESGGFDPTLGSLVSGGMARFTIGHAVLARQFERRRVVVELEG